MSSSWIVILPGLTRARPDNLLDAAQAVKQVQDHTGRYIACLEEIAYLRGYIGEDDLHRLAGKLGQTLYGQYLMCL